LRRQINIYVKVSSIHNNIPITIELSTKSLSTLDSLGWIIDRIMKWVDEVSAKVISDSIKSP